MLRSPQNPSGGGGGGIRFFSKNARRVANLKKKLASGAQAPSPELPSMPLSAFPYYSANSSTPLPPPAMPRKPLLRRVFPFLVAGAGAYVLLRTSKKESSQSDKEIKIEVSSFPVTSREITVAEKTAH